MYNIAMLGNMKTHEIKNILIYPNETYENAKIREKCLDENWLLLWVKGI